MFVLWQKGYKNINMLLDVFANIEKDLEVELTICGACEENTEKENIVNRAKELDCVTLDLRYVPDEEIVLIYK